MFSLRSFVVALALAPAVVAQANQRLIGITATSPLLLSQDLTTCGPRSCVPNFPVPTSASAGGTAWDTRTRGVWVSDGVSLARLDSRSCNFQCQPQTLPLLGALATGLAYDHANNLIYITDNMGFICGFRPTGCAIQLVSRCRVTLPAGLVLSGCAFDDVNNRLLYVAADFTTPLPGGTVFTAPASAPCTPTCSGVVRACGASSLTRPFTGLAYDACTSQFWATDGLATTSFTMTGTNCTVALQRCCTNSVTTNPYVGLCIEPSLEDSIGSACATAPCPACGPLHFFKTGNPVIGNTAFTLDGTGLPAASTAATFLNFGPCSPPGVVVPPFCGPLLVALSPTLLSFSAPTGAIAGCTGTSSLGVSLPLNTALCGTVVSSQIVGICIVGPAAGTFMSNCLSWMVTAS